MGADGILIEDLSFHYPDYPGFPSRDLLRRTSLEVVRGSLAVVLGESGSGKTTLARILGALAPRFTGGRMSGRVVIGGVDVARAKPFDLVEHVGLVFQDPDEQIITTRCDTEVAFGLESLGLPRQEIARRVSRTLELFCLSPMAARDPATLSGGEKKRLMLACLAAIDPEVWILDEAFQELDLPWRQAVLDELALRGRTGLLFDSRWSTVLAGKAQRCVLLASGSIRHRGDGDSGPLREELAEAGIVLPSPTPGRQAKSGPPILEVDGLQFSFPTGSFSLSIESLQLRRGETCALLGRNGSGKSTLARLLCGLARPDSGTILLDRGRGFQRAAEDELNRTVGYLFQNPDYQIFLATVREELEVGLEARGVRGADAARRVAEAVDRFGLPDPQTPAALMSYGSRKLLQAATYWLLERELLILDEADSGLSWRQFLALIEGLRSSGQGILLITHDDRLARLLATRILVMEEGRIVWETSGDGSEEMLRARGLAG